MATTKMWAVHSRLDHLVDYVSNTEKTVNPGFDDLKSVIEYAGTDYKTEKRFFVSGVNCTPETAYTAMNNALKLKDKKIRVLAYHGYQSFAKGEVTAKAAHEIGKKLARELWGDKFQVVVATHLNTDHFHNHFVLCSASFVDGKRFHACKESYAAMRTASDRLCREYKLSVIEQPGRGKTKHYAEWQAEQEGKPTWRGMIKTDVDAAIRKSMTERQFFDNLRKMGYEIKNGKDISVRPPGKERFVRLCRNFGDDYTIEAIRRRILAQQRPAAPNVTRGVGRGTHYRLKGTFHKVRKVTGLRALYFYYLYRMGVLPKKRTREPNPKRVYFLFREDIRFIQNISRETRLLVTHGIDTAEQLTAYKESVAAQMNVLYTQRKRLRNKTRSIRDDGELTAIKADIAALSEQIGNLRREVRLCEDIETRSGVMRGKICKAREDEKTKSIGKERTTHEPFRRRR